MTVVPKAPRRVAATLERIPRTMHVVLCCMFAIAGVVTACIVALSYLHVHHGAARTFARLVPYPAYIVDGRVVWYAEISERANALELLAGLSSDDAVAQAAQLALRHQALVSLARELGVTIPQTELESFVANDDDALRLLQSTALWHDGTYRELGVRSYLFARRVEQAALASASMQNAARGRAVRLQNKLAEHIPFYEIAMQYSEGATAAQGGDLGYVDVATLPAGLQAFAQSAATGDVSEVLETDAAFWLVKVEDVLEATEDDGRMLRLFVIEVKKDLLHDILDDRQEDMTVFQFLR